MKILYETAATVTHEARNGHVRSSDGLLDLALAMPKELGGAGGATNPGQLFAAGYAACFASAMLRVMREIKADIGKPVVTAHVGLSLASKDRFALTAWLEIALPDADREQAEDVTRAAHAICPYSNALRGNVGVGIRLTEWKGATPGATLHIVEAA